MSIFKTKCSACKKWKWRWLVKTRRIFLQPVNQYGTSKEPLCNQCKNAYKLIKKDENN